MLVAYRLAAWEVPMNADFRLVARAKAIQRQQPTSSSQTPLQRDRLVPTTLHQGLTEEERGLRAQQEAQDI